jgi:NAD(P)H-dependent flavin oxidoreductase YrpB (nitropropane dioxygenase family)
VETRFLASHDAYAHAEYKRRIVAATEGDIATTVKKLRDTAKTGDSAHNLCSQVWAGF